MIACEKAQELISCLIDNELNEKDKAEVLEHIKTCPECKAVYDAFSAVSENLGELEEAPAGLAESVMSAVRSDTPAKRKTPWVKYLSVAACLALVIFAGTKLNTPKGSDTFVAGCPEAQETCDEEAADCDMAPAAEEEKAYSNAMCESAAVSFITRSDGACTELSDDFIALLETRADTVKAKAYEDTVSDYTVTLSDGAEYGICIDGDNVVVAGGDDVYISAVSAKEIESLFE